jgi:hypothetical protein
VATARCGGRGGEGEGGGGEDEIHEVAAKKLTKTHKLTYEVDCVYPSPSLVEHQHRCAEQHHQQRLQKHPPEPLPCLQNEWRVSLSRVGMSRV